ncbi:MAG: type II toxin-antitoxin system RelE/ParE family toxin [Alphaproteobacteria bacterium]
MAGWYALVSILGRWVIWEVRSTLPSRRIARVLFCVGGGELVLLHGFIKKTQKTPAGDLQVAMKRMKAVQS